MPDFRSNSGSSCILKTVKIHFKGLTGGGLTLCLKGMRNDLGMLSMVSIYFRAQKGKKFWTSMSKAFHFLDIPVYESKALNVSRPVR